jgi:soluble lytic murein transglycosylase-like protein
MDGRNSLPTRLALSGALAGLCVLCLTLGLAPQALAQVIEIGPAGASTISGPTVFTPDGASPIAQPPPPKSGRHAEAALLFEKAGGEVELSPRLLEAVAYVESRFNSKALSPKGAQGMMQLMPETAAELGVNPANPEENVRGGADYLRRLVIMFGNNIQLALAAYNAGPSAVLRYGGVPPYAETQAYVAAVMDYLATTSIPETD